MLAHVASQSRLLPHSRVPDRQTLDFQILHRRLRGGVRWCVPCVPQGGRRWSDEPTSLGSRCIQASASQWLLSYRHDLWGQRQGTGLGQYDDNHSFQTSPGEPNVQNRDL